MIESIVYLERVRLGLNFDLSKIEPNSDEYFLILSYLWGLHSTCVRRRYGLLIVDESYQIIKKGINGNYDGCHRDCVGEGSCLRTINGIGDDEEFNPCLREELGLDVTSTIVQNGTLYYTCYDKLQQKLLETELNRECVEKLEKHGIYRFVTGI